MDEDKNIPDDNLFSQDAESNDGSQVISVEDDDDDFYVDNGGERRWLPSKVRVDGGW